jgi:ankyrin repeat protein
MKYSKLMAMIAFCLCTHSIFSMEHNENLYDTAFEKDMDYDQQLLKAAKEGNTPLVSELMVTHHANINTQADNGKTPLHFAALNGHSTITKLLIQLGANINAQDQNDATPLHLAAKQGHWTAIELLIKFGANINAQDKYGKTPLDFAVFRVNPCFSCQETKSFFDEGSAIIECLLSYNATFRTNYNPHDFFWINRAQKRQTQLKHAIASNDFKLVADLLNQGAYCNKQAQAFVNTKRQLLFQAIEEKNIETVKMLLKQGFTLNTCDKHGNTLLHKAVESGNIECVKLLVTLLYNAQLINKYLLKKNKAGFTPLDIAIINNQDILQLLLNFS